MRSLGGHKETMNPLQTIENIENQMHFQEKAQQCIFSIHLDSFIFRRERWIWIHHKKNSLQSRNNT